MMMETKLQLLNLTAVACINDVWWR